MEKGFIGLDLGTQGVRGAVVTADGEIRGACSRDYARINVSRNPAEREQAPEDWWQAAKEVLTVLSGTEIRICAVAVDGTSGTIVPVDGENRPVMNAIMYNDGRSAGQAARIEDAIARRGAACEYHFNSSYGLSKMVWCVEQGVSAERYIHQADYIVGKLTGVYDRTDMANALKSGYDLQNECWPDFIDSFLPLEKMPEVLPCGRPLGEVCAEGARETGLKKGTPVCAGATDGYASSLAACVAEPGDWASIIGTTLTIKGVTRQLLHDPEGVVYSHRHPQGWWMPGGASNVGGKCLDQWFGRENFDELNRVGAGYAPTGNLMYPLTENAERFPFVQEPFSCFSVIRHEGNDQAARYVASLEGVGYVERMCYESLESLGAVIPDTIYTTGGGCRSELWLCIRASILNRTLKIPAGTDAAAGSAMLAASEVHFATLAEAVRHMGRIDRSVSPDIRMVRAYEDFYQEFKEEVRKRRRTEDEYI